ncbi:MAG: serine/threonine-protein kinase [Planctomycetota bacterium]
MSETPRANTGHFDPGTVILERYRIVGLLGQGGMGDVYRADDITLGQSVALKFLSRSIEDEPEVRDRLLAEVRLARQVAHRNICRVYDVGEVDGRSFLSMEYVDGEDLSSLLTRIGRLPSDKALQIARELCAGLAAVHEQGIIHRDLKPGNVMIDGRGTVRLADFGLASLAGQHADGGLPEGTPAYMAPELSAGGKPSVQSDLYALGLVLYEVLTGSKAFVGGSLDELIAAHKHHTPVTPSSLVQDIDPEVETVIQRCLEKDPGRRPRSALAVSAALPGGDALAEALARGETPSPELVAATGGSGALRPLAGAAWALAAVLGFAVLCWISPQVRLHGYVPLEQPPDVLEHRAREVIEALRFPEFYDGWDWSEVSTVRGFMEDWAWIRVIESTDHTPTRWSRLAETQPPAVEFWYRASRFVPLYSLNPNWGVTATNPALRYWGQLDLKLGPTGALRSYYCLPGTRHAFAVDDRYPDDVWTPPEPVDRDSVDWRKLFELAELDPEHFRPVKPRNLPNVTSDLRLAWLGRVEQGNGDVGLRIEAAFFLGVPVTFQVTMAYLIDQPTLASLETAIDEDTRWLVGVAGDMTFWVFLVALVGGVVVVRRNFRLGRGDRSGARRLAWFMIVTQTANWLLHTTWPGDFERQFWFFTEAFGKALFLGGMAWLLYLGLEPHIRRVWPGLLVGWTRLLSGRAGDAMVGRDVLIGVTMAVGLVLVEPAGHLLAKRLSAVPPVPLDTLLEPLDGLQRTLRHSVAEAAWGVSVALVAAFVLALVQSIVRFRWLAVALLLVLAVFAMPRSGETDILAVDLATSALRGMIVILGLLRFGLLALALAMLMAESVLTLPLSLQLGQWHGQPTVYAAALFGSAILVGWWFGCARPSGRVRPH